MSQDKICQTLHVSFEMTRQFLSKFCITLQYHERYLLCTFFCSDNIYFAQKEPIKVKVCETFKCSGQNLSNSSWYFETTSRFLSNFCLTLQCYERWLLCTFLVETIYALFKRSPLKQNFLRLSSARVKNLLNSSFQFWNDKLIPLQILHHSSLPWHITPL